MKIIRKDPFTGITNSMDLDVTEEQLEAWQNGMNIQDVMPHLTANEREFLMTGITSETWNERISQPQPPTENISDLENIMYIRNLKRILNNSER